MTPAKLNMGSGPRSKVGFVNADLHAMAGVDLLCNFSRVPWPFKDSVLDEVHATDVIEHLPDTVRVMSAIDASACVPVMPEAALCITPLDRETTPPVALPGMSPTSSDASTPPPEEGRLPLAARTVVPVAVTVTCAPVA